MRNLILDYKYVPGQKTIDTGIKDLKTENIRLIVNETQHKIYCSSMQKQLVANILNGIVTIDDKFPPIEEGDKLTVEIDMGPDNNHAIEEELKHGKSKIAQNIIYKGGQSNENHSLGELADDVLTIPTPDVDIPVPTSDWERAAKAMWYSGLKYSYDIIAEYTKYQEVYKNNYPTQIIALYEPDSSSGNSSVSVGLGNADAYYFSDGTFLEGQQVGQVHTIKGSMNNHYVIYLYKQDSSIEAYFGGSMTKVPIRAMYAKNCPFVKKFKGPNNCTKGIFFDCEDTPIDYAHFYGNCPFTYADICSNPTDIKFISSANSSTSEGVFISNMIQTAGNSSLIYGQYADINLPNCTELKSTFNVNDQYGCCTSLYLPKLQKCKTLFHGNTDKLQRIDLPELLEVDGFIIGDKSQLKEINVPKLRNIGNGGFINGNIQYLSELRLDNLVEDSGLIVGGCVNLKKVILPKLVKVSTGSDSIISNCTGVTEIHLPLLESIYRSYQNYTLFKGLNDLIIFEAPKLKIIEGFYGWVFDSTVKLMTIDLPSLEYIRCGIIHDNPNVHQITCDKLSRFNGYATKALISNCVNLDVVKLGTIEHLGSVGSSYFFDKCPMLHRVEIGPDTDVNLPFAGWSPTGLPMDSKTNDLFNKDFMEGIVNNLKPTNLTHSIALSQNVKSRLYPDTIKALNDKHWVVA